MEPREEEEEKAISPPPEDSKGEPREEGEPEYDEKEEPRGVLMQRLAEQY